MVRLPSFDLFVLGCGRSGTSLVAGLFRNAGFHMGDNLYRPRPSNPKGFFEDVAVNGLNDDLIGRLLPGRPSGDLSGYGWDVPNCKQRWLGRLPAVADIQVTAEALLFQGSALLLHARRVAAVRHDTALHLRFP